MVDVDLGEGVRAREEARELRGHARVLARGLPRAHERGVRGADAGHGGAGDVRVDGDVLDEEPPAGLEQREDAGDDREGVRELCLGGVSDKEVVLRL